ncbi:hypothetical protein BDV27DRAFT_131539 [Aspergillus caelatus]|uniref:Uncharacterized protein n=1 Tax=Aspergillus caelatus TaxID=61420 RepID=A0A5N6ZXV6_9EURO|nr:uncharacterized protein BDV27DRAFT_131539 [Aspergillus caelatus]KAE8362444.1 hypothetical protein BDV27DRAFT_131539 [Aspergillus caelatus]
MLSGRCNRQSIWRTGFEAHAIKIDWKLARSHLMKLLRCAEEKTQHEKNQSMK